MKNKFYFRPLRSVNRRMRAQPQPRLPDLPASALPEKTIPQSALMSESPTDQLDDIYF
ncbi:MAG: hypothetical protein ACLSFJ_12355 [Holdemania filiformis]